MTVELRRLSVNDGKDVYGMLQEIPENENGFMNPVHGCTYEEYRKWLVRSDAFSRATELQDGWKVPTGTYWLYADGRPVGVGKIRHFLTDKLREEGGNVGYAVRPSERNKGYGTALLKELILEAGKLNIEKILLTVQNGNEASLKVAAANHGVIEKTNEIRTFVWIDCQRPLRHI